MEAEVVQMCVNMFRGGKDACGTVCILEYTAQLAFSKLGVLWMQTFFKENCVNLCLCVALLFLFIEQTLLLYSTF